MNIPLDMINNKVTSTNKINDKIGVKNEKRFKYWIKNIAVKNDKGEKYAAQRGSNYASSLNTVAKEFHDALSPYSSIFAISDIKSFDKIYHRITQDGKFRGRNIIKHYSLSSALDRYREFLIYLNTSGENENEDNSYIENLSLINKQFSRNIIYFGAPGTGKSYALNEMKDALLAYGGDYERVTFHPDYSYAHFVGTYKPVLDKKTITYSYVPGPFLRTYVKARQNPNMPVLLVIEEINRANAAAVFGDVFQLLDRDKYGVSEYPIHASEDIKKYLNGEFGGELEDYEEIRIPANMYIWATMNSADQGVFPMDTAFKRRWDFIYRGIDEGDDAEVFQKKVTLGIGKTMCKITWNALRKAINKKLLEFNVNEDKLMGPYFIQPDISSAEFINVFKNKVIMYLFEDAAKQKRRELFNGCGNAARIYSGICEEFDNKGVFIFCNDISNEVKKHMGKTE